MSTKTRPLPCQRCAFHADQQITPDTETPEAARIRSGVRPAVAIVRVNRTGSRTPLCKDCLRVEQKNVSLLQIYNGESWENV